MMKTLLTMSLLVATTSFAEDSFIKFESQTKFSVKSEEYNQTKPNSLSVAVLGDSLALNHQSGTGKLDAVGRMKNDLHQNSSVTDNRPSQLPFSLYERLTDVGFSTKIDNYSSIGAIASPIDYDRDEKIITRSTGKRIAESALRYDLSVNGVNIFKNIPYKKHFDIQVNELLEEDFFPDVTAIWIGHNNADIVKAFDDFPEDFENSELVESHKDLVIELMEKELSKQFINLLSAANDQSEKDGRNRDIIVFGLIDFETVSKARNEATRLREESLKKIENGEDVKELYPSLDFISGRFPGFSLGNWEHTYEMSARINSTLEQVVSDLQSITDQYPHVDISYSDAITKLDFSDVKTLGKQDGLHPSPFGQDLIGQGLYEGITEALK